MKFGLLGYAALATLVALTSWSDTVLAQSAEEEAIRQTSRQLSDAIARRIESAVTAEPAAIEEAQVGDGVTAWGTGAYTNITEDDLPLDLDIDIYQVTIGGDKQFGDLFLGLSASYARSEFDAGVSVGSVSVSVDGSSDTYAIGPYAAVVLHPQFYLQGLVGYTYTETETDALGISTDTSTDGIYSEFSVNGILTEENWRGTGRAAIRVNYSDPDSGDDSITKTYLVGGKLGYRIEKSMPYVQVQYEYIDPEDDAAGFDHDNLFVTAGIDVDLSEQFTAGIAGTGEVVNDNTNLWSVGINLRIKF